jgi:hypothetical protein
MDLGLARDFFVPGRESRAGLFHASTLTQPPRRQGRCRLRKDKAEIRPAGRRAAQACTIKQRGHFGCLRLNGGTDMNEAIEAHKREMIAAGAAGPKTSSASMFGYGRSLTPPPTDRPLFFYCIFNAAGAPSAGLSGGQSLSPRKRGSPAGVDASKGALAILPPRG